MTPLRACVLLVYLPTAAAAGLSLGDIDTLDYLVQDVCASASPSAPFADPGVGCPAGSTRRDLRVGESLPYHKHDREHSTGMIYQLSDAFPRAHFSEAEGSDGEPEIRVVHSLDFADHGNGVRNLTYVQFDYNVDGFNINQFSTHFASIVGTADPSGGVQYFIANASSARSSSCMTLDAWGLWDKRIFRNNSVHSHVFHLNIVRDAAPGSANFTCPRFYNDAYTTFRIEPTMTFASGKTLADVLVQQHWAGTDAASAESAEKEFFSREYGLTRWEAWERNTKRPPSVFCDGTGKTAPGNWSMVDCRDWSYTSPDPDGGYVSNRFPTPSFLISGGNWLDTGDFGRGSENVGAWKRDKTGANATAWSIEAGASSPRNLFLVTRSAKGSGGAARVYQDIDIRRGFTTVGFGATVWLSSSYRDDEIMTVALSMALQQIDQSGKVLRTHTVRLVPSFEKRQFSTTAPITLAGDTATLRFLFFHRGAGEVALDNCWVGPSR